MANYWWLKIVLTPYKKEYQKNTNLLDASSYNVPRFITKKWIEVHDQSGNGEDIYVFTVMHGLL